MTNINFKFSSEKQRNINIGREVDPKEARLREIGRHSRSMKINLNWNQLRTLNYDLPQGVNVNVLPLKDEYGHFIGPDDKAYWTTKPLTIKLTCSDTNPDYLARYDEYDLQFLITEIFGKWIVEENISEKEVPEIKSKTLIQSGLLQTNEATGQDFKNKYAFNVIAEPIREVDLDNLNERLTIMGFKIKKSDALMMGEHNINTPKTFYYEVGDY